VTYSRKTLADVEAMVATATPSGPSVMLREFTKSGNTKARPKPKPTPKLKRTIGVAADTEVLTALDTIRTKLGLHVAPCFKTNGALLKMALLRLARDFA